MLESPYTLILSEYRTHFWEITSPDLPRFQAEVTGSFVDEALHRAKSAMNEWIARQIEHGEELPIGRGSGFIIYGGGVKRSTDDVLWSKKDIQRYTGLSRATIGRRIADGTLESIKVGRRALFQAWQVKSALVGKKVLEMPNQTES